MSMKDASSLRQSNNLCVGCGYGKQSYHIKESVVVNCCKVLADPRSQINILKNEDLILQVVKNKTRVFKTIDLTIEISRDFRS